MAGAQHQRVAGVILAGGQARRMGGGDKCLLPLGGRPMLQRIVARLKPQVETLLLSANGEAARFEGIGLPVVADTIGDFAGPLAGVLAGMRFADLHGFEWIATAAADSPFLPGDFVQRMSGAVDSSRSIAIASSNGRLHPVAALWPVSLADPLEKWLAGGESRQVLGFTRRYSPCVVNFAPEAGRVDPFFNVNTPDDMRAAEAALAAMRPS